jgi:hypothetical protein
MTTRVTEEMVIAAMRAFEPFAMRLLRYPEKDRWHLNDIQGMRHALWAAFELDKKDDPSLVEAYKMARTRLERFADEAQAGRVHYDARELKRKIWGAFSDADALPSPTAWQDVSTAPKDGSEIYFLRKPPYGGTGNICIGFWHDGQNEPCFVADGTGHRIDLNVWSRWKPVETFIDLEYTDRTSAAEREYRISLATDAIMSCPAFSDFSAPPSFCARDMAIAVIDAIQPNTPMPGTAP